MSTNRLQKILNSETSKLNVNTDTLLKINIDGKEKLLPPDEIIKIVNVGDVFNNERQKSPYYRITGSINSSVSNPLFNLDDSNILDLYTWKGFNYYNPNTLDYRFDDRIYPKNINVYLKENDGWFGYYTPELTQTGLNKFYDMEPKRTRFSFELDTKAYNDSTLKKVKNWNLTITYPHSSDKTHNMVNNGLLIVEAKPAVVATRTMVAFSMACYHNLIIGDTVKITGTTGYDGEHVVVRTGLDDGSLKEYYFVVDLPPTGLISGLSRIKKVVDGIESEYYFRLFKKIKTRNYEMIENDDYESYKLSFSQNVFNDVITQFVFNEDIDISDLKDNLNRPLTQIYLSIIKTDSNNLFTNVSAGIETPFIPELNKSGSIPYLLDIPAINKIHNGVANGTPFIPHNPLTQDVNINDDLFYGDLVEYNERQVKETTLAEVSHRFNTINRETSPSITFYVSNTEQKTTNLGPRQEGYFYKAHHLIKIREFSDYIEQGDQYTVGIPDYAVNLGGDRYLWRDLLEIGANQSNDKALDYPFLNGCHYLYNNYCFNVRRQDPFNIWNLYYYDFPADPLGVRVTDNFLFNSSEDVC
jgi:hypothetical protein